MRSSDAFDVPLWWMHTWVVGYVNHGTLEFTWFNSFKPEKSDCLSFSENTNNETDQCLRPKHKWLQFQKGAGPKNIPQCLTVLFCSDLSCSVAYASLILQTRIPHGSQEEDAAAEDEAAKIQFECSGFNSQSSTFRVYTWARPRSLSCTAFWTAICRGRARDERLAESQSSPWIGLVSIGIIQTCTL